MTHRHRVLSADRRFVQSSGFRSKGKGPRFVDGTNVRAKTCECGGATEKQEREVRCIKCGREPQDAPFVA